MEKLNGSSSTSEFEEQHIDFEEREKRRSCKGHEFIIRPTQNFTQL